MSSTKRATVPATSRCHPYTTRYKRHSLILTRTLWPSYVTPLPTSVRDTFKASRQSTFYNYLTPL